jgi:hypothetical protein
MKRRPEAAVGAADHAGWAVLVTVGADGAFLDRRRIELLDAGLPCLPHHHEAQGLPTREAVALVERVRASAERRAREALEALAASRPERIGAIGIRRCPPLPPTVPERIADHRAQNVADTVLFREALAKAAAGLGWRVRWFEAKSVAAEAAKALGRRDVEGLIRRTGESLGPPWRQDQRTAMAAAIAAAGGGPRGA